MALEGLGTITNMVENICEVIKKKEDVKKMALKVVIGAGIVATVAGGAYAIYKLVVKKNAALEDKAEEVALIEDKTGEPAQECACESETKADEPAQECACGCEQKTETAEEVK